MAQQKLYTEEQVVTAMSIIASNNPLTWLEVLDSLTPIELPSDDEIDDKAEEYADGFISSSPYAIDNELKWMSNLLIKRSVHSFEDGAAWMRDKIINQNK